MDALTSILALARSGADADEPEFMREHFLAIINIATKAQFDRQALVESLPGSGERKAQTGQPSKAGSGRPVSSTGRSW